MRDVPFDKIMSESFIPTGQGELGDVNIRVVLCLGWHVTRLGALHQCALSQ